ncbi:olfactory receptor 6M1-like [Paroedura picta]|uniref:olfactory receptor 6M1-like n=1 Tax=Paroedura picta TaxID=143630 RepID=UPI00405660BF
MSAKSDMIIETQGCQSGPVMSVAIETTQTYPGTNLHVQKDIKENDSQSSLSLRNDKNKSSSYLINRVWALSLCTMAKNSAMCSVTSEDITTTNHYKVELACSELTPVLIGLPWGCRCNMMTYGKGNSTPVTEFILVGFPNPWKIEILLFLLFFFILVATMIGNTIIITLIVIDYRLHSPMYFFLCNLSFIEILITLTIVPKMMENFILEKKSISFYGCIAQSYFYFLFGTSEYVLLAMMSCDRNTAICYPLRYNSIMNRKICLCLVISSWMSGFFSILVPTVMKLGLSYCGPNVINHFFCDSAPLLHLACSDICLVELIDFIVSLPIVLGSLFLTLISYFYIISTILRIPSATGRQKAFSTCASHFTVVTIGYGTSIFIYVRPSQASSMNLNKMASLVTTAVTPMLNPIIFTFRNRKVQEVFWDSINKCTGNRQGG